MSNKKFGVVNDNDESLVTKASGKFGLNKANITVFEFSPTCGLDGAARDGVRITGAIGGREYYNTIVGDPVVYNKEGIWEDDGSEAWATKFEEAQTQGMAVITHTIKALGVKQEHLNNALATPQNSWKEWVQVVMALVPDGFDKIPVDLFLEYQWNIKEDKDRTFLVMPKNMKGGRFLSAHIPGDFKEVRNEDGLKYVDTKGNEHPIFKTADFMDSAKGYQQVVGQENGPGAANNAGQEPPKSTW